MGLHGGVRGPQTVWSEQTGPDVSREVSQVNYLSRSILSSQSLRELSRLAGERGDNVIAVSLHPGAVSTEITR